MSVTRMFYRVAWAGVAALGCLPVVQAQEAVSSPSPVLSDVELRQVASQDAESSENANTEIVTRRYDNGAVRLTRSVTLDSNQNFVDHGPFKWFAEDGAPVAVGNHHMGLRHGEWLRRYGREDAPLFKLEPYAWFEAPFFSQVKFKNGQMDGVWVIMDSRDRLVSEIQLVEAKRDGVARWYYPDGSVLRESNYKNGVLHGAHQVWDNQRKLVVDQKFDNGQRKSLKTEYYENGSKIVQSEVGLLHPKSDLVESDDWWNAKFAVYEENGEVKQHGPYTFYFPNGQIQARGEFDGDLQIRKWHWWHENGMRAISGQFEDGNPVSVWHWWSEDGALAKTKDYDKPEEAVAATPESTDDGSLEGATVEKVMTRKKDDKGWTVRQVGESDKPYSIREHLKRAAEDAQPE